MTLMRPTNTHLPYHFNGRRRRAREAAQKSNYTHSYVATGRTRPHEMREPDRTENLCAHTSTIHPLHQVFEHSVVCVCGSTFEYEYEI